jgi:hypothetical protein
VLKLGFLKMSFETDEIILPAVISEGHVIGNLYLRPVGGRAAENAPNGKVGAWVAAFAVVPQFPGETGEIFMKRGV